MDSPTHQRSISFSRPRTNSSLSVHSTALPAGIRKRSVSRARSISASHSERLEQIALDQTTTPNFQPIPHAPANLQWLTPQHSPQPQLFPDTNCVEAFPQWNVPTPPRSDSGVPTLSIDSNEELSTVNSSQPFDFGQSTTSVEMSSLGFLLPSQYGGSLYDSDTNNLQMEQPYPSMRSPPVTSSSSYGQTLSSSSPALYQSRPAQTSSSSRRHSEFPSVSSADSSYSSSYRRVGNPYGSAPTPDFSMSSGQTIPSISGLTQSPLPSPHLGSTSASSMPHYSTATSRSPSLYDSSMYPQPMSTTAPAATQLYSSSNSMSYPQAGFVSSNGYEASARPPSNDPSTKVINQRPKPQCWEHGCNGRQFSTFSNLLRHQREKSGTAGKSYCPKCGAEFTRTTARNGHLAHDKCTKNRRESEDRAA